MITKEKLSFLRGQEVEMVCFAIYSIYLHLSNNVIITIESPLRHYCAGESGEGRIDDFPLSESKLMRLLSCKVTEFQIENNVSLVLFFSNGDKVIIIPRKGYESYHIKHDGDVMHLMG